MANTARIAEIDALLLALQKERAALEEADAFAVVEVELERLVTEVERTWGHLPLDRRATLLATCLVGLKSSIQIREGITLGTKDYEVPWHDTTIGYVWAMHVSSPAGSSGGAGAASVLPPSGSEEKRGRVELFYSKNRGDLDPVFTLSISDVLLSAIGCGTAATANNLLHTHILATHRAESWDRFFAAPSFLWPAMLRLAYNSDV